MRNLGTVVVVQEFSCILACGILVPPPGICVPYIGRWIFNHWTTRVKVKVKSLVHGILQARILEWVAISFSRGSSRPRDQTQVSHIACRHFNLCTNREALKYKTPSTNIKGFKGGKEARLKEEGGGGRRGGQKRWPYRHLLPSTDTQALRDFSLGLQRREDWNSALPEIRTRIRVLCQEEVISLQSSAQAEGPSTRFLHPGPGD